MENTLQNCQNRGIGLILPRGYERYQLPHPFHVEHLKGPCRININSLHDFYYISDITLLYFLHL